MGNANQSNLSKEKRALRADQVSVEYRPSVGRVLAECRYGIGRVSAKHQWFSDRVSADMHVSQEAAVIDQHIHRVSIEISVQCRLIYGLSFKRYVSQYIC